MVTLENLENQFGKLDYMGDEYKQLILDTQKGVSTWYDSDFSIIVAFDDAKENNDKIELIGEVILSEAEAEGLNTQDKKEVFDDFVSLIDEINANNITSFKEIENIVLTDRYNSLVKGVKGLGHLLANLLASGFRANVKSDAVSLSSLKVQRDNRNFDLNDSSFDGVFFSLKFKLIG